MAKNQEYSEKVTSHCSVVCCTDPIADPRALKPAFTHLCIGIKDKKAKIRTTNDSWDIMEVVNSKDAMIFPLCKKHLSLFNRFVTKISQKQTDFK